jgi:CIC family chloride channel protein
MNSLTSRLKGGGSVGDVMEAVVLGSVRISLRLTSLKALGSWLAVVSGAAVANHTDTRRLRAVPASRKQRFA